MIMDPGFNDQMVHISQYYPAGIYSQIVPEQDGVASTKNSKPRRRRNKKNKGEKSDGDSVMRKRRLSEEQAQMLEQSFENEYKLESGRKDRLASELGLDPRQVAVWFQNRRARWKTKKLEEEYSKLKLEHETTVTEKCRLEIELQKLKEQLVEAEKEIQRLSDGFCSNSPSSSFSMEAMHPPLLRDFEMDGLLESLFYAPHDNNVVVNGLEWDNFYYL